MAFAFLLYTATIKNEYSIDDFLVTKNHPLVAKGIAGIPEIFTTRYMVEEDGVGEYRPVTRATFAVEYEFFGFNPYVSHFFNVLFYAITCWLLFKTLLKIFGNKYFHAIAIGTLLFTAHPSHTEVVASLKNRENIFSFLLPLYGIWLLLHYFDNNKKLYIVGAFLLYLLGLMSKVDAFSMAFVAGISVYFYSGNYKYAILVTTIQVLLLFAFTFTQDHTLAPTFSFKNYIENPLIEDKSLASLISLTSATLWYYLKLMIAPGQLLFYYGFNMIPLKPLNDIEIWIAYFFYLFVGIAALFGVYKKTIWGFGFMWFLLAIGLFSQLVEPITGIVGERHAYIASAGFITAIGWLLNFTTCVIQNEKIRLLVLYTAVTIIVVMWSYKVIQRLPAWKTEDTLFDADMPHLKNSAHGNYIYGVNLKERAERPDTDSLAYKKYMHQATQAFKRATEIYPNFSRLWYSLALSYNTIDSTDLSVSIMKKTYNLDSTYRSVNYFMAMVTLNETSDTMRAIQLLERELTLRKENIKALSILVSFYKQQKLSNRAFDFLNKLVMQQPENYAPYLTLAKLYLARKDTISYQFYSKIALQKQKNIIPEFFY